MATLLKIVAVGTCGILLGLLFTIFSLNPEVRGTAAGPWRGSLKEGAGDVDPYTLAGTQRSGILPLGAAEGVGFVAATDGDGAPLDAACDYRVSGPMVPARFWTLSALTPDGFPIANPARRYAFTSAEVLRQSDETVAITVGSEARSGNWLPVGSAGRYVLALRLYDSGLNAAGSGGVSAGMPNIAKLRCR